MKDKIKLKEFLSDLLLTESDLTPRSPKFYEISPRKYATSVARDLIPKYKSELLGKTITTGTALGTASGLLASLMMLLKEREREEGLCQGDIDCIEQVRKKYSRIGTLLKIAGAGVAGGLLGGLGGRLLFPYIYPEQKVAKKVMGMAFQHYMKNPPLLFKIRDYLGGTYDLVSPPIKKTGEAVGGVARWLQQKGEDIGKWYYNYLQREPEASERVDVPKLRGKTPEELRREFPAVNQEKLRRYQETEKQRLWRKLRRWLIFRNQYGIPELEA